jgi:hypothetical protein
LSIPLLGGCSQRITTPTERDQNQSLKPSSFTIENTDRYPHNIDIIVVNTNSYSNPNSNESLPPLSADPVEGATSFSVSVQPDEYLVYDDIFTSRTLYKVFGSTENRKISFEVPHPYEHNGNTIVSGIEIGESGALSEISRSINNK